jgi:hypothetical protein
MQVVPATLLALFALGFTLDAHAGGKKSPSFLAGVGGTYHRVSGDCSATEAKVEYEEESRSLHVNRQPLNDGYTSWMSFYRVNQRRERRGSDFFRWTDERSVLKGGRLRNMERECTGLVIVSCDDWKNIADVQFATGNDGTRLIIARAGHRDLSCVYLRPKAARYPSS